MSKKVLVFAAHPDDEILGCGATMAHHVQNGDEVYVVILAEGITARDNKRSTSKRTNELSVLTQSAQRANDILGVTSLTMYDLPDNRMDSCDLLDVIKIVEGHIQQVQPSIVYTHHVGDVNIDHQYVHQAVVTACRPMPGFCVETLLFFEIPSSTEWQPAYAGTMFMPNWFVDASVTLKLKVKALKAYASEMREFPHPRSYEGIDHLARWRGVMVGCEAAEAFMLGRMIQKVGK